MNTEKLSCKTEVEKKKKKPNTEFPRFNSDVRLKYLMLHNYVLCLNYILFLDQRL